MSELNFFNLLVTWSEKSNFKMMYVKLDSLEQRKALYFANLLYNLGTFIAVMLIFYKCPVMLKLILYNTVYECN